MYSKSPSCLLTTARKISQHHQETLGADGVCVNVCGCERKILAASDLMLEMIFDSKQTRKPLEMNVKWVTRSHTWMNFDYKQYIYRLLLKGIVHPKMKIVIICLPSFTMWSQICIYLSSVEHKRRDLFFVFFIHWKVTGTTTS